MKCDSRIITYKYYTKEKTCAYPPNAKLPQRIISEKLCGYEFKKEDIRFYVDYGPVYYEGDNSDFEGINCNCYCPKCNLTKTIDLSKEQIEDLIINLYGIKTDELS